MQWVKKSTKSICYSRRLPLLFPMAHHQNVPPLLQLRERAQPATLHQIPECAGQQRHPPGSPRPLL